MFSNKIELINPNTPDAVTQLATDIAGAALPVGSNFRRETWQKKIAKALKHGIRPPTKAEASSIREGEAFITTEFRKLGFSSFQRSAGLLTNQYCGEDPAEKNYAAAYPEIRGVYLRDNLIESMPILGTGIVIHELTHLAGPVKLGKNSWVAMGLLLNAHENVRFSFLEETVAEIVEMRFLRSKGLTEANGNYPIKLGPTGKHSIMQLFSAVYGEIYQTPKYLQIFQNSKIDQKTLNWQQPAEAMRRLARTNSYDLFPKSINLPSILLKSKEVSCHSAYDVAVRAILDLIPEVSKCYSSTHRAREKFEDRLLQYHQTGNLKGALKYLKGALGPSICKPLAFLDPKIDPKDPESVRDLLLMRMYVDAGKIQDIATRNGLRTAISYLTTHRSKIEFKCKRA